MSKNSSKFDINYFSCRIPYQMSFDKNKPYNDLPALPPQLDKATTAVLLQHVLKAARCLAELKGLCETMTQEALMGLLVNTVVLQESRDSSAIENIVTTQDELYRAVSEDAPDNTAAREVLSYRQALYTGLDFMKKQHNLITTNLMVKVVQTIKRNKAGVRAQPGTALKNAITGQIVYTPPCCEDVIREKLANLELFINDEQFSSLDPVLKLAIMHYQFEAIHPFADGNGRTGRILNALYLVQQNLLPQPLLYLSAYIADHKQDYYQLLRGVTERDDWKNWILFMTTAVSETAQLTTQKIRNILRLKKDMEPRIMKALTTFNKSSELFDLMFTMPYLKIEILVKKQVAHRQTASVYLKKLEKAGVLKSKKLGRHTYFMNHRLMNILTERSE